MKIQSAFTLAELLIALAILGVIAAFTVPKVLVAQQSNTQQAVMRETVALMENLAYQYMLEYPEKGVQNMTTFRRDHVNAVKHCAASLTDGCWTAAMYSTSESSEPGFILHSGAYVTGAPNYLGPNPDGFMIDWNGPLPPNALGQDTYQMSMCLAPPSCVGGLLFGRMAHSPDYIRALQ